jgi:hypothetical protein
MSPCEPGRTPRMSQHARLRCTQMGVTTKRAKHVVRHADVVYPGSPDVPHSFIALCEADRQIAVVYAREPDGALTVLTVLYRGVEFVRPDA